MTQFKATLPKDTSLHFAEDHTLVMELPTRQRDAAVRCLVADAVLGQFYAVLRRAVVALSNESEDGFRICPDCGIPAVKDSDEWYGPWPKKGDRDKLECMSCGWIGDWAAFLTPCVHCGDRPVFMPMLPTMKFVHASQDCPLDAWSGEDGWEWEEANVPDSSGPGNEKSDAP